jgi:DNA helicase II / ATP-dependent DNA helicase PcrA
VRCADEDGQADAVCERILQLRESGLALQQQAVLIRAAHHSDRLELELSRRLIPYVKYGGLRYLEAGHVKDLLAAFRLVDNPRDELSWFRLLQLLDGVGPATARKAVTALGLASREAGAGNTGEDSEVLLRWPLACAVLPAPVRVQADALAQSMTRLADENLPAHAQRLRMALQPLIEAGYDNAQARLTDLDALVDAAAHVGRLSEVAADNALEPPRSTGELAGPPTIDEDWLTISTVHSAKGLEWDAVHVIHAADGNFPSDMALGSTEGLEEERRLFYVAMTRPKDHLNIYVPLRYHHHPYARDDKHSWAQPSRFVTGAAKRHLAEETYTRAQDLGLIDIPIVDMTSNVDESLASLWQ